MSGCWLGHRVWPKSFVGWVLGLGWRRRWLLLLLLLLVGIVGRSWGCRAWMCGLRALGGCNEILGAVWQGGLVMHRQAEGEAWLEGDEGSREVGVWWWTGCKRAEEEAVSQPRVEGGRFARGTNSRSGSLPVGWRNVFGHKPAKQTWPVSEDSARESVPTRRACLGAGNLMAQRCLVAVCCVLWCCVLCAVCSVQCAVCGVRCAVCGVAR